MQQLTPFVSPTPDPVDSLPKVPVRQKRPPPTTQQVAVWIQNATSPDKAIEIFQRAKLYHTLDGHVYAAIVKLLCRLNYQVQALLLLEQMEELDIRAEQPYIGMVNVLGEEGSSRFILDTLHAMQAKNISGMNATYLAMINVLSHANRPSDLREVLQHMHDKHVKVNDAIHSELCVACAKVKQYFNQVKYIVDLMREDNNQECLYTQASLEQLIFQRRLLETQHDIINDV